MTEPDHDMELIERLCRIQHDAYEAAAAEHGWSTQQASRVPWDQVPTENRATMEASMRAVLAELGHPYQAGGRFDIHALDMDGYGVEFRRMEREPGIANRRLPVCVTLPTSIWHAWGRPVTIHAAIAPTRNFDEEDQ